MRARLVGIGLGLLLSGCSVLPGLRLDFAPPNPDPAFQLVPLTAQVILQEQARLVAERSAAVPPGLSPVRQAATSYTYRVGRGDVLQIVVFDHPELTPGSTGFGWRVESDGTIFFPYVGVVNVAGLTVAQIRADIGQRLRGVLQSPQVDVQVAAFQSQRVQVTGEVVSPGLVALNNMPKGVFDALHERGWVSPTASQRTVLLIRNGVTYTLDLAALIRGDVAHDVLLEHGDVVYVPDSSREKVFVLGEVGAQQALLMDRGYMTLTEAIASSGGLSISAADRRAVYVFRNGQFVPAGSGAPQVAPQVFLLDLSRADSLYLASAFELQARDVVYIGSTDLASWNRMLTQVMPTVTALFTFEPLIN